jgi:hypothetical protein
MIHEYNSRRRQPRNRRSSRPPRGHSGRTMATAQDNLDAVAAVGNRIHLMEVGQTNTTTQLANITQQLVTLIGAPPLPPGHGPGVLAPQPSTRRRLDPSTMEKLYGDASNFFLRSLRNRWDDYATLNQLSSYPAAEQTAALRMCLEPSMHRVVEILRILPTAATTPDAAFDLIGNYARGKWNVDLDRAAFEERWRGPPESFEDLHVSLIRFADAEDLCGACIDCRMATGLLAGIRDSETKKKLALSPFPTTEAAVNLCRSVESAQTDEKIFSTQTGVSSIQAKQNGRLSSSDASSCGFRGRSQHPAGQIYPAIGKPRPPGDRGGSRHEYGGGGNKTDGGMAVEMGS